MITKRWRYGSAGWIGMAVAMIFVLGACQPEPVEEGEPLEEREFPEPMEEDRLGTEEPEAMTTEEEVEVTLRGYEIEMPESLPAGMTTFLIRNEGQVEHSFEIEGQGIEKKLEEPLMPNQMASLEVELTPGSYTIYCPVGNHRERGMERQLEVQQKVQKL